MKMLTTRLIARLILEIDFSDHMQGPGTRATAVGGRW